MHEKSLVRSLLKQVEQLRIDNGAISVDRVTVELGPLSGVESELIRSAFEELVPDHFTNSPVLDIRQTPLQICCRCCRREAAVDGFHLQCPECSSTSVRITRGDEFRLIDVSMQIPVST